MSQGMSSDPAFDKFKEYKRKYSESDEPQSMIEEANTSSNSVQTNDSITQDDVLDHFENANGNEEYKGIKLESYNDDELLDIVADEWIRRGNNLDTLKEKLNDILLYKNEVASESVSKPSEPDMDKVRSMFK